MLQDTRTQMDHRVYANLNLESEMSAVKHARPCCYENAVSQCASNNMSMGADQARSANRCWVSIGTPDDGVFHDDAVFAQFQWFPLGDYASSKHNTAARSDGYVATQGRVGRHISGGINARSLSVVLK